MAGYAHDRLMEIWAEHRPDVIVSDNVVGFAAVPLAGVPWVRMVSANPLEMEAPDLPPPFSGLPTDDPRGWAEFTAEYRRLHDPSIAELSELQRVGGRRPFARGPLPVQLAVRQPVPVPGGDGLPAADPLDSTWTPPRHHGSHRRGALRRRLGAAG